MSASQKLKVAVWVGIVAIWTTAIFVTGMATGVKITLDRNTPTPTTVPVTVPDPGEVWTL